jgi:hypothetical protein
VTVVVFQLWKRLATVGSAEQRWCVIIVVVIEGQVRNVDERRAGGRWGSQQLLSTFW